MEQQEQVDMLKTFAENPYLCHKYLFPTRRENDSPPFHKDIIELLHSGNQYVGLQSFRGAAKTTLVEEMIIIKALFAQHKYILIIGSTYTNACKLMASIKNQFMINSQLGELFGWQESEPWTADTLVLKNGVKIEAMGAGQAMRGAKFNESRPSLVVLDDLEDEESAATKLAREKVQDWFYGVVVPALHPTKRQILMIGTPIHPEALIEKFFSDPSWVCKRFPLLSITEQGEEVSNWPSRFPIEKVREIRDMMYRSGQATKFAREYLCSAEDEDSKPFKRHMIKVSPQVITYYPTYIVCDPARTVNQKTSARTGYVCAAWQGTSLVVLDALGAFHMPNEIIDTLFEWNRKYKPISVGVESNALDEFIRQPLRNAMLERHEVIPLQDLRAPRDKDSFIRALQPFYNAGMVSHIKTLPDLENELMAYPSGRRDVVNALAYLLLLRPGNPVYSDFTEKNIITGLQMRNDKTRCCVVSCRRAITAMVITQLIEGSIRVLWDSVAYAPPDEVLGYMWQDAVQIGGDMELYVPYDCLDSSLMNPLKQAASKLGLYCKYGKNLKTSEGSLRHYLQSSVKGEPAFVVNPKAKYTINGMLGGYCRKLAKDGSLHDNPIDNEYQIVIEAIECWAAALDTSGAVGYTGRVNYGVTKQGIKYLTTRPGK